MEILELEMRARAIRALLKISQSANASANASVQRVTKEIPTPLIDAAQRRNEDRQMGNAGREPPSAHSDALTMTTCARDVDDRDLLGNVRDDGEAQAHEHEAGIFDDEEHDVAQNLDVAANGNEGEKDEEAENDEEADNEGGNDEEAPIENEQPMDTQTQSQELAAELSSDDTHFVNTEQQEVDNEKLHANLMPTAENILEIDANVSGFD